MLKDQIHSRIFAELQQAIALAIFWTIILIILAFFGIYFDVSPITAWIIDFVIITYAIQGIINMFGMAKTILEIMNSQIKQIVFKILGVSLIGILQTIAIPLLGYLFVMGVVILLRSYLGVTYGGGFFIWAFNEIYTTFSHFMNSF